MKQAVMVNPGKIEIREIEAPKAAPGKVLVQIGYIGICGSDIHVYHGKHPYTKYPVVQGHEVSGVVVSSGDNGTFQEGDKVTIEPQISCGKCGPCREGLYNICNELKVMGFQSEGAASEYVVIDEKHLVKLPEGMDLRHGAMMEPLAVGVRAVRKFGEISGTRAAVLGAGPIGNLTMQAAKALGAKSVIISDVNALRLEKARECGADETVEIGKGETPEETAERLGECDVIFDCAGVQSSIDTAVCAAGKGKEIIAVAVYEGKPKVDLARVNECELRITGTARYTKEDFETAIALTQQGVIELDELISDVFPLEEYKRAYEKIDGDPMSTMKVLVRIKDRF